MTANEKTLDIAAIYERVLKIDAHIEVIYLASLQVDQSDLADTLKTVKDINWQIHDLLEGSK